MTLTNIIANISSLNDKDKEYILDYLTRHFSPLSSQQGALIGELTNSPMYRSKKADKWIPFIECMLNDLSLRETVSQIGITHVTAFYWRHKVLSALAKESIGIFEGLVEVDETYFLESHKGRRVIQNRKP